MEEQGEAARSFQCPYHAWTYDFEGKLIAAPNLTKMPDIDRDEYGLVKVHVREYLGYVWVCLADQPPSFEEEVMGAIEERLGDVPGHLLVSGLVRVACPNLFVSRIRNQVKLTKLTK